MKGIGKKSFSLTSGQARRAARIGHPELSVECPKCHAAVGRTCFMPPGILGVTHSLRKLISRQQSVLAGTSGFTSMR
jgi:hypothetical protein